MLPQNGFVQRLATPNPHPASAEFVAVFVLRVARHEQDGLSPSCAVLAAASELGIDPAGVLRAGERT